MRRKINLLLAFVMIATQLSACGSPQEDGKNSSVSGEAGSFYTKQAVESWYRYEEEYSLSIQAEEVRINGVAASAWPVTVAGGETVEFHMTAPASAGYYIVAEYHPVGDILATDALYEIRLNGGEVIEAQLPILWHDSVRGATDRSGNESTRKQESLLDTLTNPFLSYSDISRQTAIWNLEEGESYTFSIVPEEQGLELSGLMLCRMEENSTGTAGEVDDVPTIPIEAEEYSLKSDSYIGASSVRDASLSPYDTYRKKINVIESSAWKSIGQKILWEFETEEEGNYRLGLHVKQNEDANKTVFRTIEIDGRVPSARWKDAKIPYTGASGYHNVTFQDDEGDLILHLTKGKHTIAMTVSIGDYKSVYDDIRGLMDEVNDLGTALLRITGGVTDENRTWDMESYMPDAVARIEEYADRTQELYQRLEEIDGKEPVYAMDLLTAEEKLRKLLKEPEKIPGKTEEVCRGDDSVTKYLGNVLSCLSGQGASVDRIYLYGKDQLPREDVSVVTSIWESVKRFVWSFSKEAENDNYSISEAEEDELEVWVAQSTINMEILQELLDETYNKEQGTNIRLKVLPAENKLVLANATGTNPDVVLCTSAGQPFTFGCRGALKNLLEYDDFLDFYTENYQLETLVSTAYGDGIYGAVDSRNFQLLFYRKDILDSLNLSVPQTWEDVETMMPTLLRNQMSFYIPISVRTSLKGLGVTTPFIYQMGGEIYSSDGRTAVIDSEESVAAITEMTEFYRIYGMQTTVENFYLSFRYGEIPIGVGDFNTYLQLKMAAPELAGQWGVALCPGTEQEDGTILRYQPANSTASMIFANTNKPQEAWKFLKWWLDSDTQYEYSIRRCQSLGLEYQWNTANIEAFRKLPFDSDVKEMALEQWQHQREVTPHPASYIVERELSGVWNDVVISNEDMMNSLDQAVLVSDREIERKLKEFGYIDDDGKLIRDYNVKILEMLYSKAGKGAAKDEE